MITGCSSKQRDTIEGDVGRVNQMNNFFYRFDHPNSLTPRNTAPPIPSSAVFVTPGGKFSTEENVPLPMMTTALVCGELTRLRPSKTAGLDGVSMTTEGLCI